ncbi:MAG: VWA domain-containing protein [Bacteroidota bacterium]
MAINLEEEFERFIEFGGLLDRKMRRYLVQYLKKLAGYEEELPPILEDTYYQYFSRTLDHLFESEDLLELVRRKEAVSEQIICDTLNWMRKAHLKANEKNPFEEEESRLQQWNLTPLKRFVGCWHLPVNYLRGVYTREDLDVGFYEDKYKGLIKNRGFEEMKEEELADLDIIFTDMLAQWDALLQGKKLEYQLRKVGESQETFQELIEAKVNEYNQLTELINPFSEYTGRYWDLSRELWKDTSFNVLEKYRELLEDDDSIRELVDMLGKMREAEIEIEEETFQRIIVRKQWMEDYDAKAEIDGVHASNDLNALLTSETSLLADPDTETVFLQKYADKQLMTFRYIDRQLVTSEHEFTETDRKVKQKEKGPFIVCVDTSDSMTGRAEQIAKVVTFAIIRMAAEQNRRAYLINFSVGIKTIDLFEVANSIDRIAEFLQMSFRGGTDISLALHEVLRQLRGENYRDADVLVISDFIMYRVEEEIMRGVRHFQQNKSTQFHSLTLSEKPLEQVLNVFDSNWIYDPRKKGIIKELAGKLNEIGNRII